MARRATRRARPGGAAGSYAQAIFNRVWRAPAIVEAASHGSSPGNASMADVARSAKALVLLLGSSIVAANVGAWSIALLCSTVALGVGHGALIRGLRFPFLLRASRVLGRRCAGRECLRPFRHRPPRRSALSPRTIRTESAPRRTRSARARRARRRRARATPTRRWRRGAAA